MQYSYFSSPPLQSPVILKDFSPSNQFLMDKIKSCFLFSLNTSNHRSEISCEELWQKEEQRLFGSTQPSRRSLSKFGSVLSGFLFFKGQC